LVIATSAGLCLLLVVRGLVGLPAAGSFPLFMVNVVLYLFFVTALGLLLGTLARSMPQFGLLAILIVLPMILLSGGYTPLESIPPALQFVMQAVPTTHFVKIAQAILFRGGWIGDHLAELGRGCRGWQLAFRLGLVAFPSFRLANGWLRIKQLIKWRTQHGSRLR
jgi:ABC-type multidrug transport system permease subunit